MTELEKATRIHKTEVRARRLADGHLRDEWENAHRSGRFQEAKIYDDEISRRELANC